MKVLSLVASSLILAGCAAPGQSPAAKRVAQAQAESDEQLRNFGVYQAKALAESTTQALTIQDEAQVIADTQRLVSDRLKDPGSAQFRNVRVQQYLQGPLKIICGEINAKNSYGGYVGFRQFAASPWGVYMESRGGRYDTSDELSNFGLMQACS
ncbi:hypothetical protein [Hydrogenophaga sp. PML113]|uniref:hypothetical protein n=1 Tax=Hydrogenophaga sp. PML113 TaxID=1899350 RepID=UPI0008786562|nr:hypothetical protein [Hydrogenophaga sp. PML113]